MPTITLSPSASAHDAWEGGGAVTLTGNLTLTAGTRWGGLWVDATAYLAALPGNVTAASLKYYCVNTSNDDPDGTWWGEKVITPAVYATSPGTNISARNANKTTASAADTATGAGTGVRTITITSIIQELVGQAGWTGPLALHYDCGGAANFHITSFDTGSNIWSIEITYQSARPAYYYAMMRG